MALKIFVLIACVIACYNAITGITKTGGTSKAIANGFILLTMAAMARIYF